MTDRAGTAGEGGSAAVAGGAGAAGSPGAVNSAGSPATEIIVAPNPGAGQFACNGKNSALGAVAVIIAYGKASFPKFTVPYGAVTHQSRPAMGSPVLAATLTFACYPTTNQGTLELAITPDLEGPYEVSAKRYKPIATGGVEDGDLRSVFPTQTLKSGNKTTVSVKMSDL